MRDGRLCCSSTAELAKALTEENKATVLPRFFGLSALEAQEVVAPLQPTLSPAPELEAQPTLTLATAPDQPPDVVPLSQLRTSEVAFGGVGWPVAKRDEIEPLSAERSRIHVNVSREFLKKLKTAQAGLSNALPGATTGDFGKARQRVFHAPGQSSAVELPMMRPRPRSIGGPG